MTTNKSLLHKFLREPLLHFLLIGGALFFAYSLQNEGFVENNRIIINEAEIDRLITLWERKKQRLPTQSELQNLIDQQVREEVMYREALAMGLDQNDGVVRRRLAQKVEFISADLAALVEPTEAELTNYQAAHSNKFELPGRINFTQVYINSDKHGANTQNYADSLLIELTQDSSDIGLETLGDSIMLDQRYEQVTEHDVTRLFGKDFANKIFTLPIGSWQGPLSSGYGPHLVRIDNKTESRQPKLDTVREKVHTEWLAQQRREMDKVFYESLRQRYEIVIKKPLEKSTLANTKP